MKPATWLGGGVAVLVCGLDQLTKWLILAAVMDPPRQIVLAPFFNLVLVYNKGVSFGLLKSDSIWTPYLLSGLALAISVFLVLWLRKAQTRLLAVSIGMVLGGAIGNVVDRLHYGAVVDFLDFYLPGTELPHFPAFNMADSAISVGVGLMLLDALFESRRKPI
jgi:signal peptidase II